MTADYSVDLGGAEPQVTLANLAVTLTGLVLKMHGGETPFLEMPDLRLSNGRVDLIQQQVEVGKLALTGGRARLAVDENGTLNLERIVKASKAPASAAPPVSGGAAKPWKIHLAAFDLSGLCAGLPGCEPHTGAQSRHRRHQGRSEG